MKSSSVRSAFRVGGTNPDEVLSKLDADIDAIKDEIKREEDFAQRLDKTIQTLVDTGEWTGGDFDDGNVHDSAESRGFASMTRDERVQVSLTGLVRQSRLDYEVDRRGAQDRGMSSMASVVSRTREVSGKTLAWVELSTKSFIDNAPDYSEKSLNYTKPELRERLKREIMAGSRGGKPGQWSARKAQLLANEYRKAGGGYRGKPRKIQRSLKSWTRQKWRTSDGKPAIRKGGTRRYLPAKAWSRLTPAQRAATNRKKIAGSKAGRQFVANTERAESASRSARR